MTGSLNASIGQWQFARGLARESHVARQGTAMGRCGIIHVSQGEDDEVWAGGGVETYGEWHVPLRSAASSR